MSSMKEVSFSLNGMCFLLLNWIFRSSWRMIASLGEVLDDCMDRYEPELPLSVLTLIFVAMVSKLISSSIIASSHMAEFIPKGSIEFLGWTADSIRGGVGVG